MPSPAVGTSSIQQQINRHLVHSEVRSLEHRYTIVCKGVFYPKACPVKFIVEVLPRLRSCRVMRIGACQRRWEDLQ